jgi:hypothetical protein
MEEVIRKNYEIIGGAQDGARVGRLPNSAFLGSGKSPATGEPSLERPDDYVPQVQCVYVQETKTNESDSN